MTDGVKVETDGFKLGSASGQGGFRGVGSLLKVHLAQPRLVANMYVSSQRRRDCASGRGRGTESAERARSYSNFRNWLNNRLD